MGLLIQLFFPFTFLLHSHSLLAASANPDCQANCLNDESGSELNENCDSSYRFVTTTNRIKEYSLKERLPGQPVLVSEQGLHGKHGEQQSDG